MLDRKDFKLFWSLCLWAIVPSIYLLIRMQIVSVNSVDINVLGQMEWFDLIDEIIVTTLNVPLYYLLKPDKNSKAKNGLALIISFTIYCLFTLIVCLKVNSIAEFMLAKNATQYLLLQAISMLAAYIGSFGVILFTLNDDNKTINVLLVSKLVLLTLFDLVLINKFSDLGAAYSDILANLLVSLFSIFIMFRRGYLAFSRCELSWTKEWLKKGFFAGVQIFLDNYIYAVMIVKMVNAVNESGNYWVSNNFIWGWLLVPVHALGEIIRKNDLSHLNFNNTFKYSLAILAGWIVTMPVWGIFIDKAMAVDSSSVLSIVYPSIPFYIAYILSVTIDSWFISKGKTIYNTINSLFVNLVYYGIVYLLFRNGAFTMNMNFIIYMFGWGNVVHLIVSICLYWFENKNTHNLGEENG